MSRYDDDAYGYADPAHWRNYESVHGEISFRSAKSIPLPPCRCNATEMRRLLDGEDVMLWSAFAWSDTPHGHAYWSKIAAGERTMSRTDRAWLKRWLADGSG